MMALEVTIFIMHVVDGQKPNDKAKMVMDQHVSKSLFPKVMIGVENGFVIFVNKTEADVLAEDFSGEP